MSFMTQPGRRHSVISTVSYWLPMSALFGVGGAAQGMNPRRQGSLGPFWKLAAEKNNRRPVTNIIQPLCVLGAYTVSFDPYNNSVRDRQWEVKELVQDHQANKW